jgi:hypothetical protein
MPKPPHRREPPASLQLHAGPVVTGPGGPVTARVAGGLQDLRLPISPTAVPLRTALQNLAKAINIAFDAHFLENELEAVYKVARVVKGTVEIQHADYIGLGDGVFATLGKVGKSLQLTLRGPDPASPAGKQSYAQRGRKPISGLFDLLGRKLNLLQEFEDQVPSYVEQMLDRLEAANMIVGWSRDDWQITTKSIGLDVVISPRLGEKKSK